MKEERLHAGLLLKKQKYMDAEALFMGNRAGGVVLKRPFFCGISNNMGLLTCPVCQLAGHSETGPPQPCGTLLGQHQADRRTKLIIGGNLDQITIGTLNLKLKRPINGGMATLAT